MDISNSIVALTDNNYYVLQTQSVCDIVFDKVTHLSDLIIV